MELDFWIQAALELGFDTAVPLSVDRLVCRQDVRQMCAADACRAYGKNWTCPPHCGTLEDCAARIQSFRGGILLQTVGRLEKVIDTRGIRRAEQTHLRRFYTLAEQVRQAYPEALCLGSGGCRVCAQCAFPESCRFPEKACASMEGYGLFVTQVCRDHGVAYHHGEKTVTFTACILIEKNR